MSDLYRVVVKHVPGNEALRYTWHVYDEAGELLSSSLTTTREQADSEARAYVTRIADEPEPTTETWVDGRGRDAAAPEGHSARVTS